MKRFEIEVRAKRFALVVIQPVEKLPKKTSSFVIGKQLLRSATSIGANLVEGRGGVSKKDFINFLSIARKSAIETTHGSSGKYQPAMICGSFFRQLCSRKVQDALHLITFRLLAVEKNLSQISSFGIFQNFRLVGAFG